MKTCPECMNQVVDPAIKCKYCGYDFPKQDQVFSEIRTPAPIFAEEPLPPTEDQPNSGSKNKTLIFLLILAFITIVIYMVVQQPDSTSTKVSNLTSSEKQSTVYHVTLESYYATQTVKALITPTITPTSTPDLRTNFERCEQLEDAVIYTVTGTALYAGFTWTNDTNGTEQGDYDIPFCMPYAKFKSGDFVYISAQILSDHGNIDCKITYKGQVIASAHANGFPSIATCNGRIP